MPAVGGSPVVLCDAVDARDGSWSRHGDILFGTAYQSIFHVSASGGRATPVTQVDEAGGEYSHWFPRFLPDGNRFLYYVVADDPEKQGVYLESLDHRHPKRRVVVADGFCFALALDPEKKIYYLLSQQTGKIAAQIFDVDRGELSGPSHILLDRPGMVSVSDTGVLVIRKFGQDLSRLVWRDRTGRELGVLGGPADYESVHLSPDDRFAAITRQDQAGSKIWIASLPDGKLEPLSDSIRATNPTWSADSGTVYYTDNRRGVLVRRRVSPRGAEEVVMEMGGVARRTHMDDISPNGRYAVAELIADYAHAEAVWTELKDGSKSAPQWHSIDAPGKEGMLPSFSPDGRWLAFSSNPTGGSEIYVMDFPGGSQRVRVSTDGGFKPRWRRDGKELFYLATDGSMMAARMSVVNGRMTAETTRPFDANLKIHTNYDANYAVSRDGQRFLGIARETPSGGVDIQMVLNWPSLLQQ
jgi:Tol biopolymer transport system component